MMSLTTQETNEVGFWQRLYEDSGHEGYLDVRRGDLEGRTAYFPDLMAETGHGLDYGCGLVSIFEFAEGLEIEAYDPLVPAYQQILDMRDSNVRYRAYKPRAGIVYDFVVCFNVADHTPDIPALFDHIESLLVPGGRLYFEVNFDPELFAECHHTLWTLDTVREYLARFDLVRERVTDSTELPGQSHYEAVLTRR